MLPLGFEVEEPIPTPTAEVLWERYDFSGSMDELMLPLGFEVEEPIQTPIAEVLWERCGYRGGLD